MMVAAIFAAGSGAIVPQRSTAMVEPFAPGVAGGRDHRLAVGRPINAGSQRGSVGRCTYGLGNYDQHWEVTKKFSIEATGDWKLFCRKKHRLGAKHVNCFTSQPGALVYSPRCEAHPSLASPPVLSQTG